MIVDLVKGEVVVFHHLNQGLYILKINIKITFFKIFLKKNEKI